MDDNIDRANDELEMNLVQAIQYRKSEGPKPTGKCLWCEETTGELQRWCDASCRDQWEEHHKKTHR